MSFTKAKHIQMQNQKKTTSCTEVPITEISQNISRILGHKTLLH